MVVHDGQAARWLWRCAMAKRLITVNDILAGHVSLDVALSLIHI